MHIRTYRHVSVHALTWVPFLCLANIDLPYLRQYRFLHSVSTCWQFELQLWTRLRLGLALLRRFHFCRINFRHLRISCVTSKHRIRHIQKYKEKHIHYNKTWHHVQLPRRHICEAYWTTSRIITVFWGVDPHSRPRKQIIKWQRLFCLVPWFLHGTVMKGRWASPALPYSRNQN